MLQMPKLRGFLFAAGTVALLAITAILNAQHTGYDPALWSGLKYRMIGPERGGRVTAVTGVPSEPFTFYMGSTGGGVWKTTDAGHTWTNVSDGYFSVALDGRCRSVAIQSRRRVRRHRVFQDPQQRVHRARHVQIHRCRAHLDLRGAARCRPDLDHSGEPRRSRPGVRGGTGQSLRAQSGPRRIPLDRRRQELEEDPLPVRHPGRGRSGTAARAIPR